MACCGAARSPSAHPRSCGGDIRVFKREPTPLTAVSFRARSLARSRRSCLGSAQVRRGGKEASTLPWELFWPDAAPCRARSDTDCCALRVTRSRLPPGAAACAPFPRNSQAGVVLTTPPFRTQAATTWPTLSGEPLGAPSAALPPLEVGLCLSFTPTASCFPQNRRRLQLFDAEASRRRRRRVRVRGRPRARPVRRRACVVPPIIFHLSDFFHPPILTLTPDAA